MCIPGVEHMIAIALRCYLLDKSCPSLFELILSFLVVRVELKCTVALSLSVLVSFWEEMQLNLYPFCNKHHQKVHTGVVG